VLGDDIGDGFVQRRVAEQILEAEANDSLRDFVAVASHDLRSPLVTIGGFTKILTDNWPRSLTKTT
jgi:signal transduction histidine kinase